MHPSSTSLWETMVRPHITHGKVLELGSNGQEYYRRLLPTECEYYEASPGVVGNGIRIRMTSHETLDIEDNFFDFIYSVNVMEHVRYPWQWVDEQYRVLKRGGVLAIIAPWSYAHHAAEDHWRFHATGMRLLADWANLETIVADTVNIDSILIARKPR